MKSQFHGPYLKKNNQETDQKLDRGQSQLTNQLPTAATHRENTMQKACATHATTKLVKIETIWQQIVHTHNELSTPQENALHAIKEPSSFKKRIR